MEQIFETEIAVSQIEDAFFTSDHMPADVHHHFVLFFRAGITCSHLLGLKKELVPVIDMPGAVFFAGDNGTQKAGGFVAVVHRDIVAIFEMMGEKHGRRVALPGFLWLDIHLVIVVEDVNQHLCGLTDSVNCFKGVVIADQGEIRHGIEFVQVGACDPEKVAHHEIGGPGQEQVREGVEDVKYLFPLLGDDIVDGGGKGFKPRARVKFIAFDLFALFQQRIVLGEAHVDHAALVFQGFFHK